MVKDNFFGQPVGRAVLYLNDFHFGKNLNVLNRAARLVPNDVKGFASLLSNVVNPTPDQVQNVVNPTPDQVQNVVNPTPDQVQDIVNLLDDYANDVENDTIFKLNKS